jgi:UDP-glucose 4-epimerase
LLLAAGYIGSHMVLDLLDVGEDVIVLDNLSTGFRSAVPDEAKFVEGDIGDHNLVRPIPLRNPVDAIIHFGGSIVVPD